MKSEDLLRTLNDIDDQILLESEKSLHRIYRFTTYKVMATAACLAIIVLAGLPVFYLSDYSLNQTAQSESSAAYDTYEQREKITSSGQMDNDLSENTDEYTYNSKTDSSDYNESMSEEVTSNFSRIDKLKTLWIGTILLLLCVIVVLVIH